MRGRLEIRASPGAYLDSIKNLYSSKKHKKAISFDEYVLKALIRRAIPDATIIQQAVIPELGKRSAVDFYVEKEGNGLYLEFDGTSHFAKLGLYEVRDSRDKKAKIEDVTGKECVCWPFWIQRCEQNVKVLFDDTICGHGALWSTKCLFGNFCIDRPSELIIQETKRFNAIHQDGLGYFYGYNENETRMMPKHSVISQILKGKKPLTSIIPHDIHDHFEYWLPSVLWPLL